MTEQVQPVTAPAPGTVPTPQPGGNADKVTFTPEQQEALNKMFGERAEQGRRTGQTELLKELGFEKPEDLKAALAEATKLRDAQKTELEKAQDAAKKAQDALTAAQAEKDTALKSASERLMRAEVMTEAMKHNPPFADGALDDVWLFVDKSKIAEKDGKFSGVAEAINEVAKAKAYLLKAPAAKGPGTPGGGSGKPLKVPGTNEAKRPIMRL
jgi:hypothetical protein